MFAGAWRTSEGRAIAGQIHGYFVPRAQRGADPKLTGVTKGGHCGYHELRTRFVEGITCVSRGGADNLQTRAGKLRDKAG